MAGHGRAPKPPAQRRNRHVPQRGEWVDLEPLAKPVLPTADRGWSEETKRAWSVWRSDPVTSQYGPADVYAVRQLALLMETENPAPNELRLRMDGLGLTPKGKRDLRWRTPGEVAAIKAQPHLASVQPLKLKDPSAA